MDRVGVGVGSFSKEEFTKKEDRFQKGEGVTKIGVHATPRTTLVTYLITIL